MLAPGTYRARALQAALGETSTGKEQVAVEFQTLDIEGTPGPSITWFGYFSDKAMERTVESLRICGWRGHDLSDLSGISDNEVEIVVEQEEWEGKVRTKVRWVNAPGGMALKAQLDPAKAKSFAERMKGKILAMEKGSGQRRAPAPVARVANGRPAHLDPDPPPHTDDDELSF